MFKDKGRKIEEKYSLKVIELEKEINQTQIHLNNLLNKRKELYKEIIECNSIV